MDPNHDQFNNNIKDGKKLDANQVEKDCSKSISTFCFQENINQTEEEEENENENTIRSLLKVNLFLFLQKNLILTYNLKL